MMNNLNKLYRKFQNLHFNFVNLNINLIRIRLISSHLNKLNQKLNKKNQMLLKIISIKISNEDKNLLNPFPFKNSQILKIEC